MSDEPKPEADALEQAQPLLDDGEQPAAADSDLEVAEADRLEQRLSVSPPATDTHRRAASPEVPDADAAEQDRAVVDDEEDRPD
jgi:hypothetical protein